MKSCQGWKLFQVQSLFSYKLVSLEKGRKEFRSLWQVAREPSQALACTKAEQEWALYFIETGIGKVAKIVLQAAEKVAKESVEHWIGIAGGRRATADGTVEGV